ncbi:hydroxylysine kinase isoform X1 [Octopus bimaculoides]|nr:hydroxylysine kinase isoform X1 [Octopus bimaculoides]
MFRVSREFSWKHYDQLHQVPTSTKMDFVDTSATPVVRDGLVNDIMSQLYGMEVVNFTEMESYIDRNYLVNVKKTHRNPYIKEVKPHGYVLKIFNGEESKDEDYFDACYFVVDYLREYNIPVPERIQRIDGKFQNRERLYNDTDDSDSEKNCHMIILLTFVPGVILSSVPLVPSLLYNVGKLLGRMSKLLQNFSHPFFQNRPQVIWNLEKLPILTKYLEFIEIENDRMLVEEVIETFKKEILPNISKYQKGHTHGDYSHMNIIVRKKHEEVESLHCNEKLCSVNINDTAGKIPSSPYGVSGIIDFGHTRYSYIVHDVAISIAYISLESKIIDSLDVGGHILAGYFSEIKLNSEELDALPVLICGRLAKSLTIGRYVYQQDTTNLYPLRTSAQGWPLIRKIWKTPKEVLLKRWNEIISSYGEN